MAPHANTPVLICSGDSVVLIRESMVLIHVACKQNTDIPKIIDLHVETRELGYVNCKFCEMATTKNELQLKQFCLPF